jgi:hypothetical protein
VTEREHLLEQINRLVISHALHGSESLCKLLRYLAKHAVEHPGVPIKEFQIATEVFGRSPDFDPQLDSMVRVQAGRLRSKLTEYYSSDGLKDPFVVELPKGTYVLSFHHRNPATAESPSVIANGVVSKEALEKSTERRWGTEVISLSIFLAAAITVIVWLLATRTSAPVGLASETEPVPAAYRVFWRGFTSGQEEPWVVFSNAAFVGRPETGMRYRDATRDSGAYILDHYTGVGEVLAVHELDRVFGLLRRRIRVKR